VIFAVYHLCAVNVDISRVVDGSLESQMGLLYYAGFDYSSFSLYMEELQLPFRWSLCMIIGFQKWDVLYYDWFFWHH
jgi:hypothetical protein